MNEIITSVGKLRELFQRSIADGDFSYEHNLELGESCDTLSENANYETWAPLLFELIDE